MCKKQCKTHREQYISFIVGKLEILTLLKIKSYIYGDLLAAAGCQLVAVNLRPVEYTHFTVN